MNGSKEVVSSVDMRSDGVVVDGGAVDSTVMDCCESEREEVGRVDLKESLEVEVVLLVFCIDRRVRGTIDGAFCEGGAIPTESCALLVLLPAVPDSAGEAVHMSSSSGAPFVRFFPRSKPRLRAFCILSSFSCLCLSLSLLWAIRSLKLLGFGAAELLSEVWLEPHEAAGRLSSDPN